MTSRRISRTQPRFPNTALTVLLAAACLSAAVALAGGPPSPQRPPSSLDGIPQIPSVAPGDPGPSSGGSAAADPTGAAPREELAARIDACVTAGMARAGAPGAAVALVVNGELVYEQGYGVKHHESGGAVRPDTLFRTGSTQKMMTAAAVMSLVERGALDLDEPLTGLIPELTFAGRWGAEQIRVEHLLTHSAAVPDHFQPDCGGDDGTLAAWAATLGETFLYAPSGSFYNYSNAGYSLAGLVAERAAGMPYRRVMEERVWAPAGMDSTFLAPETAIEYGDVSHGHVVDPTTGAIVSVSPDAYECRWSEPSGLAFTTAGDLARWAMLMLDGGGDVLFPESVAAMQAPQVPDHVLPTGFYGYGIVVQQVGDLSVRSHDGRAPGWGTYLLWVPDEAFAVAIVDNGSASLEHAALCALDAAVGIGPGEPFDTTTDPSAWTRYAGTYAVRTQDGESFPLAVAVVDGEMLVAIPDSEVFAPLIFPAHQLVLDTFFVDFDGNGAPNPFEVVTFIETGPDAGGATTWLRNRVYVGYRFGKPVDPEAAVDPTRWIAPALFPRGG